MTNFSTLFCFSIYPKPEVPPSSKAPSTWVYVSTRIYFSLRASCPGCPGGGAGKGRRASTTTSDWQKSESPVGEKPQENWGWNSNSRDVVASSLSSPLRPAARASRRACSRANIFRLDFRRPLGPPRTAGFPKQRLVIESRTYFLPVHPSTSPINGVSRTPALWNVFAEFFAITKVFQGYSHFLWWLIQWGIKGKNDLLLFLSLAHRWYQGLVLYFLSSSLP